MQEVHPLSRLLVTVGVQPGTKLLRIERLPRRTILMDWGNEPVEGTGAWMVWINANRTFTAGTFVCLHDNGTIDRVTVNPDGTEEVFVVKSKGEVKG